MILALYIIGSAAGLLLMAVRLREAREEIDRVRKESDDRARAVRDEYRAYTHGVTMALACLLAGMGAAPWYTPPRPGRARENGTATHDERTKQWFAR